MRISTRRSSPSGRFRCATDATRLTRATEKVSAAPGDGVAPAGAGIAAATGTVVPGELPDILMSPDVAVLERAVRERPDVAAAVLDQYALRPAPPRRAARPGARSQRFQSLATGPPTTNGARNRAANRVASRVTNPAESQDDGRPAHDGGPDRVGGDRR